MAGSAAAGAPDTDGTEPSRGALARSCRPKAASFDRVAIFRSGDSEWVRPARGPAPAPLSALRMSLVGLFIKSFQQARCVAAPPAVAITIRATIERCAQASRSLTHALTLACLCRSYAPRHGYNILSSKRGNKNHYKGKGASSTGHHTRKGGYRLLAWKLPDYVVPDLAGFEVRARAGGAQQAQE
jgi:hypothetical protein